jgi:hypothetical protein
LAHSRNPFAARRFSSTSEAASRRCTMPPPARQLPFVSSVDASVSSVNASRHRGKKFHVAWNRHL